MLEPIKIPSICIDFSFLQRLTIMIFSFFVESGCCRCWHFVFTLMVVGKNISTEWKKNVRNVNCGKHLPCASDNHRRLMFICSWNGKREIRHCVVRWPITCWVDWPIAVDIYSVWTSRGVAPIRAFPLPLFRSEYFKLKRYYHSLCYYPTTCRWKIVR